MNLRFGQADRRDPIFIAEIGMNHDGSFDLACELIREAQRAGADIVKFQLGWRSQPGELNHLAMTRAHELVAWCRYMGVEPLASVISEEGFDVARQLDMPRYKIASRTVHDNPKLVERVLAEGKETFISLGMHSGTDWPFGPPSERLRYLFCRSKYPTYPADLGDFPAAFGAGGFAGYSDHCLGIAACLLALSRGAAVVEKHFTLNKTSQVIRDHVLSATPDEFHELTTLGRDLGRLFRGLAAATSEPPSS